MQKSPFYSVTVTTAIISTQSLRWLLSMFNNNSSILLSFGDDRVQHVQLLTVQVFTVETNIKPLDRTQDPVLNECSVIVTTTSVTIRRICKASKVIQKNVKIP